MSAQGSSRRPCSVGSIGNSDPSTAGTDASARWSPASRAHRQRTRASFLRHPSPLAPEPIARGKTCWMAGVCASTRRITVVRRLFQICLLAQPCRYTLAHRKGEMASPHDISKETFTELLGRYGDIIQSLSSSKPRMLIPRHRRSLADML